MYDNIGGKIKVLAKVMFIVAAIFFALIGIVIALFAHETIIAITGLLVMILGPIFSWIATWLLYGFGELIEKATDIEYNTRRGERKPAEHSINEHNRIRQIEKLHSNGMITEEEYQKAISKYE